ncbi:YaiO family outer membrane beta-barrel protein [Gelidibacter salicanalis]|uniref:YaiO family outer membrane beta-barrel protein n=1 Tax=Gelidibacter salicanalis TaxID=291193 RepID=A0A934KYT2_9FLAO|nr:YaiO family outer membrane beta-barrel protein [Gelidibacter salicanalis]MBJ7881830.1 YaiO family outer membrane beta-barrel protein [Gelidibacter salicanalis]
MKKILFVVIIIYSTYSFGQKRTFDGDPDVSFKTVREMAFNDQRKQAQDTLRLLLTTYPNYHDIRSFLANTYSWDGNYDLAKKEFEYILKDSPDRLDDWKSAITNELRSDSPFNALEMTSEALKYFPEHPDVLYLKASAEADMDKSEEAFETLNLILKEHPEHEDAKRFRVNLIDKLSKNTVGVSGSVDVYSETFDPMQYYLLKYVRDTKYGSIHGKININNRFSTIGAQFEVDMYPKITKGLYAYANIGVSSSSILPKLRFGAELYKSLPKSFEASLGFRTLKYSSYTTILTGSVGWYTSNNYWSFRTYVTPGDPETSVSGTLSYRRYRKDENNYFSASIGIGYSPEIYRFYGDGNEDAVVNLDSQKLNLGYNFSSANNKNLFGIKAGIDHQEISFNPGEYLWIYSISLSWDMKLGRK